MDMEEYNSRVLKVCRKWLAGCTPSQQRELSKDYANGSKYTSSSYLKKIKETVYANRDDKHFCAKELLIIDDVPFAKREIKTVRVWYNSKILEVDGCFFSISFGSQYTFILPELIDALSLGKDNIFIEPLFRYDKKGILTEIKNMTIEDIETEEQDKYRLLDHWVKHIHGHNIEVYCRFNKISILHWGRKPKQKETKRKIRRMK